MQSIRKKIRARKKRASRVRGKVRGTATRPRLSVFRSLRHVCAQFIDDEREVTLGAVSTSSPRFRERYRKSPGTVEAAGVLGEMVGDLARGLGIKEVVFDRGGYQYHGRVKALAEAARKSGLKF
jgi:large subunit ribosomal protein L18